MATFKKLVRGNWAADNSEVTNPAYDIKAEVQISGEKKVNTIVNGRIDKDGVIIGTFMQPSGAQLPTFTPQTTDAAEAMQAYQAIIFWVADVAKAAEENPPFNA